MSRKKKAFLFNGNVDLSQWDFNRIEWKERDALEEFISAIDLKLEKETKKLHKKLRRNDEYVRKIISETFEILLEDSITAGFWDMSAHPEIMTIYFGGLAEDGYEVELDLREAIREALLRQCDTKDGYVEKENEQRILKFAQMLDELSAELRTAIRPEENKNV
jgi:hypothetical protein